jgi:peptidoglycan/LPS O-acetylase OafA/YrhL
MVTKTALPQVPARNASSHVPALDGIRGLAILLILMLHLMVSNTVTGSRVMDGVVAFLGSFWVGVDLFFVLSGFLITGILFDSLTDDGFFRKFYARRFLRIFPLYYGFLFLLLALTRPLHLAWNGMQWMLLTYLQNTGLVTPLGRYELYFPTHTPSLISLNHFWSLAVEEQFYLFWPLVVFLVRDRRRLIGVALGASILALILRILANWQGASPFLIYSFTPFRMDSLLLGACLALLMRGESRTIVIRLARPVLVITLSVLFAYGIANHQFSGRDAGFIQTGGYTLIAIAGAALIAETFHERSLTQSIFRNRLMRFLGKYSYGIYVFHFPLDTLLTVLTRHFISNFVHSKAIAVVAGAFLIGGASILVAVISYTFYEYPLLKLKRYFEYDSRRVAPETART